MSTKVHIQKGRESLSGAARALGLTQPTNARHIEAREQGFGLNLFVRSQQGPRRKGRSR